MYMEMFEKVFNLDEISFDKLFEEIMKLYEKNVNAENEKKSYFNSKGFKYQNGELVDGFEKECVNGKCVKDETFNKEHKALTENKADVDNKKSCCEKLSDACCNLDECCKSDTCCNEKKVADPVAEFTEKIYEQMVMLNERNKIYEKQFKEMKHYIDVIDHNNKVLQNENDSLRNVINNIKNCF